MTVDFEIIVGTYEQFMIGYKIEKKEKKYNLERSFAIKSHTASIRTLSSERSYVASGGADDVIYIYDMRNRLESGKLIHHNDTVNCVSFTQDASHILTCSSDGTIGIIRCGNWQLEKYWTVHKSAQVNTLAVHPTGKLALSVATDGVLRTWNLVKGRQAYAINLVPRLKHYAKNISILNWSLDGQKYLMASNVQLDIYSIATAGIDHQVEFDSKINCIDFITDDLIVIGHENGVIRIYNITEKNEILKTVGHDRRVKCIKHSHRKYIVSASSSGDIKLWKYVKQKLTMLTNVTCDARITCMTLAHVNSQ